MLSNHTSRNGADDFLHVDWKFKWSSTIESTISITERVIGQTPTHLL